MFNWFDLMKQAQTDPGLDALTRQFRLSQDQTQKAMAAFLPAFALGMQHAAASNDPGRFFQSMMSGSYQNFWQAAMSSFSPQAQQEGRRLLDQMFGSDETSRRVAHQAADYAGISAETMQQLLPLLAGILAGGMSRWMGTAQAHAAQAFTPAADKPKGGSASIHNPWADLWTNWMKGPTQETSANSFAEMMAPYLQAASPPPSGKKEAPPASSSWEDMARKGGEAQMQYLSALQSILDDAWKTGSKAP
jgi:hypothetical protein